MPTDHQAAEENRRIAIVQGILALTKDGACSQNAAAAQLGVSPAKASRLMGLYQVGGLSALRPRSTNSGRRPIATLSEIEKAAVRQLVLRTDPHDPKNNRRIGVSFALRTYARSEECRPELAEAILKLRSSKHTLTPTLKRAARVTTSDRLIRDGDKAFDLHGICTPRDLTFIDFDGVEKPITPGLMFEADDMTANEPCVVEWDDPADPCAARYGVRVVRPQVLFWLDVGTGRYVGYSVVLRYNDAYPTDSAFRRRKSTRLIAGTPTEFYSGASPSWASAAPVTIMRIASVMRADALSETIRSLAQDSANYLEEVIGRFGIPVTTDADAGPTLKARMKIAVWDLPIRAITAQSGVGPSAGGSLWATQTTINSRFTEVLGDAMTAPEDEFGPISTADASWEALGATFATVARAGGIWSVMNASETTRGKYRLCGAQIGDADGAEGLGRMRQARYTVRTVERDASSVIVSDVSAVQTSALDAALGMQATAEVAVEPSASGHTVAVTVTQVEMLDDTGAWAVVTPSHIGMLTRVRTGVWGFAGGAAAGDPVVYYREIRGLSRRQITLVPSAPPSPYSPPPWGERGEQPDDSDLNVEEHAVLTIGADGVKRWHTTLRIHGVLHGRDFEYEADFGLRTSHLAYTSTGSGINITGAATVEHYVAAEMLNATAAFLPTAIVGGGWVIPDTIPGGSTITATQTGTSATVGGGSPGWQDNVVIVGHAYPARLSWAYLDQTWTRVSGGAEGHAYISADTTTLSPPADEQMVVTEWWGLLGAGAEIA